MLVIVFLIAVLALVLVALYRLRADEKAERRLERSEYEPQVRHFFWQ